MEQRNNTYTAGRLTFLFYPTVDGTYVGACEELCLVCEDTDSELVRYRLLGESQSYLKNVSSGKLGEHLLNQSLPKEIKDEFFEYRKKKGNENFERWTEDIPTLKRKKIVSVC